jgi:predicted cupin superfamily sugar epimerase
LGNDLLNQEVFQYVVPANSWFAVENAPGTNFGLVGCTVAPGFDFADFEMADKKTLQGEFPQHFTVISRLCR